MKIVLSMIITVFFIQSTLGQSAMNSKDELSKHSEAVMKLLKESQFQKAFIELKKHWPLPENEMIQLQSQMIKQFNLVADRFGDIIEYDFIRDEIIKDYVVKKIYVLKFDKHMIRILFTYYKNNDGWILNTFKYDDEFEELFEYE
jgi:hypothetical protein